jgi:NAD(P)-dependent dehydrogenase (short-subunit alcohol dehydrogenase family)
LKDFRGKTAFVTGGASGFGLEYARAFLAREMNVALADIDGEALNAAIASLDAGARVRGFVCDVADLASMRKAADDAISAFGRVHIVCNNAGVGGRSGGVEELPDKQWLWVMSINLMGVVHGVAALLPHIRAHGEEGWFINTASMAGMLGQPQMGPYCASKAAVVGLSETMFYELRGTNVGVSVLCPGFARTGIARSKSAAPEGEPQAPLSAAGAAREAQITAAVRAGIEPSEVVARAIQGMIDRDLYVFTHPEMRPLVTGRIAKVTAAYDKAERFQK